MNTMTMIPPIDADMIIILGVSSTPLVMFTCTIPTVAHNSYITLLSTCMSIHDA